MERREFIKKLSSVAIVAGVGNLPLEAFAKDDLINISILHTNDTHSRIEPFPMDGGKYAGLGGIARRKELIDKIRDANSNTLLLDAGDFFQGTPYFNYFKGEIELKMMSELGYDAATIGNHDFDASIENLAIQLKHANFPLLISNYDFTNTPMKGKSLPYKIFNKSGVKIGVFGIGIKLDGLVSKKLYGDTVYLDPIKEAQKQANFLKNEKNCDLVICLSHLGLFPKVKNTIGDRDLAKSTSNIDLIIGGHTHTFLDQPEILVNKVGEKIPVAQVGWAGIKLGQVNFTFSKEKKYRKNQDSYSHLVQTK